MLCITRLILPTRLVLEVESGVSKPRPFTVVLLHQLFPLQPLTSRPHESAEARGVSGVVWVSSAMSLVTHWNISGIKWLNGGTEEMEDGCEGR